jgi:hypothetical protein
MSQENVEFLEAMFAGAAEDKQALLDALRVTGRTNTGPATSLTVTHGSSSKHA